MKKLIPLLLIGAITFASCSHDKRERKVRFMADTDMYEPVPYEAYQNSPIYADGLTSRKAPKGTIARGYVPYELPNTNEGYNQSMDLASPVTLDESSLTVGKKLYGIYCAVCHGTKGDGNGELVKQEKYLGVPNYKDRDIKLGSIVHVINYGKGVMGSHASQLKSEEKWKIAQYVLKLKADL